jgi:hypothetical protein
MSISNWMSWEGGVDVVGVTDASMTQPNVIVHVARMVNTPVGSAPSGMILWAPSPDEMLTGFVSSDATVGDYFGPKIFAGTPFEQAPTLVGQIDIQIGENTATSRVEVGGHVFEVEFSDLGPQEVISREPGGMTPFTQQGLERKAGAVRLKVDGVEIPLFVPETGITGGPGAVVSACGVYAR